MKRKTDIDGAWRALRNFPCEIPFSRVREWVEQAEAQPSPHRLSVWLARVWAGLRSRLN